MYNILYITLKYPRIIFPFLSSTHESVREFSVTYQFHHKIELKIVSNNEYRNDCDTGSVNHRT